ncbi:MAG: anion transporter [Xanthomonadales bacterium]|nr:anion transporter [Xanthomonadales bacterium]
MTALVIAVFVIVYLGMALGRLPGLALDRSGIALCGAALMLAAGALPQGDWSQVLDLPTLVLLFALMLIGGHFAEAGAFDAVARMLSCSPLSPLALLGLVVATSGLLSALLVNDIVVFALTPLLAQGLAARALDPRPFLLGLALASNAGSAATLVGNPQNLLIGELGQLDFLAYLGIAALPSALALLCVFTVIAWVWRGRLAVDTRAEALAEQPLQRWLLMKSLLAVLAVMMAMLMLDRHREIAALAIAGVLLAGRSVGTAALLKRVDWSLLVLIASLFVVTAAFAQLPIAGAAMAGLDAAGLSFERLGLLVPAALIGSNTIGNVPLVMLLVETLGELSQPALTALAIFSTLAGNLLLLGSLANLITAERAAQAGVRLGFADFARVGIPVTLISTALALAWLLLRGWSL